MRDVLGPFNCPQLRRKTDTTHDIKFHIGSRARGDARPDSDWDKSATVHDYSCGAGTEVIVPQLLHFDYV